MASGDLMKRSVPSRLFVLLLAAAPGCSPPPPPAGAPVASPLPAAAPARPARPSCGPFGIATRAVASLTVRLPGTLRPAHAPEPRTDAERVVFRHLYETLVTLDCEGELRAGLADSWAADADARRWTFRLRPGARFWDGRPVTARDVREAWIAAARHAHGTGCPGPWAWLEAEAASVRAVDARHLAVALPEAQPDFARLLAHPAFALALAEGDAWPLGSGAWRPAGTAGDTLLLLPSPHAAVRPLPGRLAILAVPEASGDPSPDELPDVALLRRPPPHVAGGHAIAALPWDRLYLLLLPRPGAVDAGEAVASLLDGREAVCAPATFQFPDADPTPCPQIAAPSPGAATTAAPSPRIARPREDRLAGLLAERLVSPVAAAPDSVEWERWPLILRAGGAEALVVPVHRCFPSACLQVSALLGAAPWLRDAALAGGAADAQTVAARLAATGHVVPLLMTRPHVAVRASLAGVRFEHDGTLRLDEAGAP